MRGALHCRVIHCDETVESDTHQRIRHQSNIVLTLLWIIIVVSTHIGHFLVTCALAAWWPRCVTPTARGSPACVTSPGGFTNVSPTSSQTTHTGQARTPGCGQDPGLGPVTVWWSGPTPSTPRSSTGRWPPTQTHLIEGLIVKLSEVTNSHQKSATGPWGHWGCSMSQSPQPQFTISDNFYLSPKIEIWLPSAWQYFPHFCNS